jgi:hypothetical protein
MELRGCAAIIAAVLVTACTAEKEPSRIVSPPQFSPQPACQLGCIETDPFPNSPGLFFGSGASAMACLDGLQNDLDFDGIGDYCEKWIAPGFAPELFHSSNDDIRAELRA